MRGADGRALATRSALQAAALQAFAERGFSGASTRAIAATAGVPQGLIRHHFGGKQGLYERVVQDGAKVLSEQLRAAHGPTGRAHALAAGRLLLALLLHGLLEPGPRRAFLLRAGLAPVLAALGHADARWGAGEHDALAAATALYAPLLAAALLQRSADPATLPELYALALDASLGAQARPEPARGPWAPRGARR